MLIVVYVLGSSYPRIPENIYFFGDFLFKSCHLRKKINAHVYNYSLHTQRVFTQDWLNSFSIRLSAFYIAE